MSVRLVTVALIAVLTTPTAWSCDCVFGPMEAVPNDATDVPTTARIFVEYNFVDSANDAPLILVATDTGAEVPHTIEDTVQGDTVIRTLTPEVSLDPQTAYAVYEDRGQPDPWELAAFTTGEGEDTSAPSGAEILSAKTHKDRDGISTCGGGVRMEIALATSDGDIYEIEATRESGDVQTYTFLTSNWIVLGHGACLTNMPDLEARERLLLRSRVLDVSGNASPWSDPVESRRAGCSSTGSRGLTMVWLPLLALLGIRLRS